MHQSTLTLHLTDDDTATLDAMGLDARCRAEVVAESIVVAAIREYRARAVDVPRLRFARRGVLARRLSAAGVHED